MKTTWKKGLVGTSAVMMLVLAGCGGKEARSIQTPAAGGVSGVISTQSGSLTTDVKEDDNNKTTMKKFDTTRTRTTVALNPDLERQIKEDYVVKMKEWNSEDEEWQHITTDDVLIDGYVGEYSGCYALFLSVKGHNIYNPVVTSEDVAGYRITYTNNQFMSIYKEGEFSSVTDAYEKGWITREDVKKMAKGKTVPTE